MILLSMILSNLPGTATESTPPHPGLGLHDRDGHAPLFCVDRVKNLHFAILPDQQRILESPSSCLFGFPEFAWRNPCAIFDAAREVEGVGKSALFGDFGQG